MVYTYWKWSVECCWGNVLRDWDDGLLRFLRHCYAAGVLNGSVPVYSGVRLMGYEIGVVESWVGKSTTGALTNQILDSRKNTFSSGKQVNRCSKMSRG